MMEVRVTLPLSLLYMCVGVLKPVTAQSPLPCSPQEYIATEGGPVSGRACVFPFDFHGNTFSHCTSVELKKGFWCATTKNYPEDRAWGLCPERLPAYVTNIPTVRTNNKLQCVFPFTYKELLFYNCTTLDSLSGQPWCNSAFEYHEDTWGYCEDVTECFDSFDRREDTQMFDGIEIRGVRTQEECDQWCRCDSTCQFYQWQKNKFECWIDRQLGRVHGNRALDLYQRVTCTPPAPRGNDTFQMMTNMHALGGILEVGAHEAMTCGRSCLVKPKCVAFDLDFTHEALGMVWCYHHLDVLNLERARFNEMGVMHYLRVPYHMPVTRPGPGPCVDVFEKFPLQHELGGVRISEASSRPHCAQDCLNRNNCTGFDFNVRSLACYLHYGKGLREGVNDTDHYVRRSCSPVNGSNEAPPGCRDVYQIYEGRHALNGTFRRVARNPVKCMEHCNDHPSCVSIDFNTENSECFLHLDAAYILNPHPVLNIDHYVRTYECTTTGITSSPGECVPKWLMFTDTLAYGGWNAPEARTVEACQAQCENSTSCIAFDYNSHLLACWLHTDPGDLLSMNTQAMGINHYRRAGCEGCEETFTVSTNSNAQGGQQVANPSINSVAACREHCALMSSSPTGDTGKRCYGVDYDKRLQYPCWVHTAPYTLNTVSAQGVDNYRRDFSCETKIRTTTLRATTKPTRKPTTLMPGGCKDEFQELSNSHAIGGDRQGGVTSLLGCKGRCLSEQDGRVCLSFDFRFSAGCWLHYGRPTPTFAAGVSHYVRDFTCTVSSGCKDDFAVSERHNARYGVQQPGDVTTVEACRAECVKTRPTDPEVCFGFDFVAKVTTCWLHFSDFTPVPLPVGDANDIVVVNYKRIFKCPVQLVDGQV